MFLIIDICTNVRFVRCLLLLLFLLSSINSQAQKKLVDADQNALKSEIARSPKDSNRVKLLRKLAAEYCSVNPDSSLKYTIQTLELARQIKWDKGIAKAYMALGVVYENRSDYPQALAGYMDALRVNEKIGNQRGIAASNWGIGNIYRSQKQIDKAIAYTNKAMEYYLKEEDEASISSLFVNLGNSYYLKEQLDSAVVYFSKALALKEKLGDTAGASRAMMNIGSVYSKQNDYNKCLAFYFRSLRMMQSVTDQYNYGCILGNIGQCYLAIAKEDKDIKPDSLVFATPMENVKVAIGYLDSALKISKALGEVNDARITSLDLSEGLELYGNFREALAMYKEHVAYKDSIYSVENIDKIAAIEVQRVKELKDKDIQIARLRTEVYMACIVLLLLAVSYIAYRLAKQINSNRQLARDRTKHLKRIDSQSKILQHIAHIQSHDLRGNLVTILGLAKLFNFDDPTDPFNKEIIANIDMVATKMDGVVTDVINEENRLMLEIIELGG